MSEASDSSIDKDKELLERIADAHLNPRDRVGEAIGRQFDEVRRIIREIHALPEGAANQGADKIRELQAVVAEVNDLMSDLKVTVVLLPDTFAPSEVATFTEYTTSLLLRLGIGRK